MKELSLHILDIVQNSVTAGASVITIVVNESNLKNTFEIEIADNGKGMNSETLAKVTDPFYTSRTTRRVGLGLPLFKQTAEICNGNFTITSLPGKGTTVKVSMPLNHIDRQPMGDISGVLAQLVSSYISINFMYNHKTDIGSYVFNAGEVKKILGDTPINNARVIQFIRDMIKENITAINAAN